MSRNGIPRVQGDNLPKDLSGDTLRVFEPGSECRQKARLAVADQITRGLSIDEAHDILGMLGLLDDDPVARQFVRRAARRRINKRAAETGDSR